MNSGFNPATPLNASQESNLYPEFLKKEINKSYEQAKRSFINSLLRRESGATITDKEYLNKEKELYPQVNDSDKNIEQKAITRQNAINAMKFSSAGAYDDLINTQVPTNIAVNQKSFSPISKAHVS